MSFGLRGELESIQISPHSGNNSQKLKEDKENKKRDNFLPFNEIPLLHARMQ
jgi:hypothetical protein